MAVGVDGRRAAVASAGFILLVVVAAAVAGSHGLHGGPATLLTFYSGPPTVPQWGPATVGARAALSTSQYVRAAAASRLSLKYGAPIMGSQAFGPPAALPMVPAAGWGWTSPPPPAISPGQANAAAVAISSAQAAAAIAARAGAGGWFSPPALSGAALPAAPRPYFGAPPAVSVGVRSGAVLLNGAPGMETFPLPAPPGMHLVSGGLPASPVTVSPSSVSVPVIAPGEVITVTRHHDAPPAATPSPAASIPPSTPAPTLEPAVEPEDEATVKEQEEEQEEAVSRAEASADREEEAEEADRTTAVEAGGVEAAPPGTQEAAQLSSEEAREVMAGAKRLAGERGVVRALAASGALAKAASRAQQSEEGVGDREREVGSRHTTHLAAQGLGGHVDAARGQRPAGLGQRDGVRAETVVPAGLRPGDFFSAPVGGGAMLVQVPQGVAAGDRLKLVPQITGEGREMLRWVPAGNVRRRR